jgi:Na+/H+-translocating membrane pyrophosphatase
VHVQQSQAQFCGGCDDPDAFLAAIVSGIVLLTMSHGGCQGGRKPDLGRVVLFLTRESWNDLHVWGSLAMIAGIIIHLVLHWRWMVCMVKRFVGWGEPSALRTPQPLPVVIRDGYRR